MEIDELPSGKQDRKPDIDMNGIVGTHDILMLCFDTLRYDVSVAEEASGGTPVLNSYGSGWEKRHAPGNFTYPSHFAIFAGFLPSPAEPHVLRSRKWLFFPFQAGTGRIPPEGSYAFKEATFVQSLSISVMKPSVSAESAFSVNGMTSEGYFPVISIKVTGCLLLAARIRTVPPIRWTLLSVNWKSIRRTGEYSCISISRPSIIPTAIM